MVITDAYFFFLITYKTKIILKSVYKAHWKRHSFHGKLKVLTLYYNIQGLEDANYSHMIVT